MSIDTSPEMEWRPIETAPKDGSSVLGWRTDRQQMIVFWFFNGNWHCDASYHWHGMLPPTHWMPLPSPPK